MAALVSDQPMGYGLLKVRKLPNQKLKAKNMDKTNSVPLLVQINEWDKLEYIHYKSITKPFTKPLLLVMNNAA